MPDSTPHSLTSFFEPQAVALVGASAIPTKLSGKTLDFLKRAGFDRPVYPVNARGGDIQGLTGYTSLRDIPGRVDQAILTLPAGACEAALDDCVAKGVTHVQIFSSGFAEAGPQGQALQRRLVEKARRHGIRLIGPNCLGLLSVRNRFFATFGTSLEAAFPAFGGLSIATQSGAFGSLAYATAIQRGIGLSRVVATGNEADVDVAECIDFMAQDPDTRVICAAIEGCQSGERLRNALERAADAGKPVIVIKVGTTAAGRAAAASHTGALAGNDAVYDAVLSESGAYRVRSIEEMLDIAYASLVGTSPRNFKAGILTNSGGIGIQLADEAERRGIELPALPAEAAVEVGGILPYATMSNPLDTTAQSGMVPDSMTDILGVLQRRTDWGVFFLYVAQKSYSLQRFAPILRELELRAREHPDRCIVLISLASPEVRARIETLGIPVFEDPNRAVAAISALSAIRTMHSFERTDAEPPIEKRPLPGVSDEHDAKRLLQSHGLPILDEVVCRDREDVQKAIDMFGFPVVAKILSPDIAHKTEIGGVILGIRNAEEAHAAYATLLENAAVRAPHARIEGVLFSPMLAGGVETILGVHVDEAFGPMVMLGLGGVAVEVFEDTVLASAPISQARALKLARSLKSSAMLGPWRGRPAMDVSALADTLVKLSRFAATYADDLASVDINPFLVREQGGLCLDALIVRRGGAPVSQGSV